MGSAMIPSETLLIPPMSVGGIGLVSGRGIITGYAIRENTGAAVADFDVIDGQTAGGNPVLPLTLNAHESDRQWFSGGGILFQNGLFVNVTAGTIRGVIFAILEQSINVDGVRVVFAESSSGAYMPVDAEIDMERG